MSDDPKCVAGCVPFYGGEKRHHKDCPYYPESLTKANADRIEELEAENAKLKVKLAKAVELGLEECPFWDGSGAYNDWWHDRRTTLAELTGEPK